MKISLLGVDQGVEDLLPFLQEFHFIPTFFKIHSLSGNGILRNEPSRMGSLLYDVYRIRELDSSSTIALTCNWKRHQVVIGLQPHSATSLMLPYLGFSEDTDSALPS